MTDPLGMLEIDFASPQFIFRFLQVFNICIRSTPARDLPSIVIERFRPHQMPTVLAIVTSKPRLDLTGLFRGNDLHPPRGNPIAIVRMKRPQSSRRLERPQAKCLCNHANAG